MPVLDAGDPLRSQPGQRQIGHGHPRVGGVEEERLVHSHIEDTQGDEVREDGHGASCGNFAGKWGWHGQRTFVHAFRGFHPGSTCWVRETYRTQFGTENSYRQMNEGRIRTCSRSPLVAPVLLRPGDDPAKRRGIWFHPTTLSERQGRRLILHLERLRFRDILLNLQRVVEFALGITQSMCPQPQPP